MNMVDLGMCIIKTDWHKTQEDKKKNDYSSIKPTGIEKQNKYDKSIIKGGYIYNRCHLIAWKLGGNDVDKRNIITGTQQFNIKGMKPFEDITLRYLKENRNNHILYKVTPNFEKDNKIAYRS